MRQNWHRAITVGVDRRRERRITRKQARTGQTLDDTRLQLREQQYQLRHQGLVMKLGLCENERRSEAFISINAMVRGEGGEGGRSEQNLACQNPEK